MIKMKNKSGLQHLIDHLNSVLDDEYEAGVAAGALAVLDNLDALIEEKKHEVNLSAVAVLEWAKDKLSP